MMRLPLPLSLCLILVGCTAGHHANQADKEVYQILKKAEHEVFGKKKAFSIDTKYSKLDPSKVEANQILAESQKGGKINLGISEALNFAANHSRTYQSEKEQLYLTALSLSTSKHQFKNQASSSVDLTATHGSDDEETGNASATQRLSKNLLAGGSYSLSLANDLFRYFTGDPRKSASSIISLNITQPLLRGAGKKIAAEGLTQANRNVIYAVRDYSHFQNEFSRNLVIQYLRLLQQKETVKNEHANYKSRQANTEYLKARAVDRASPQEVSDSEQGELQAKNRWINAKARYQSSLDDFKITLGLPTSTALSLHESELDKLVTTGLQPHHLTPQKAFQIALKNRLPLMNEVDRFDDSKRQIYISADRLKTSIDFVGSATLVNSNNSLDDLNFNNISRQVGLQIDLPVNKKRERNDYRRSLMQFQSSVRSLSLSYDNLNNLVKRRIRDLNQFRKNYEIQKGAVKLAKKRVEGNRLRLKAGTLIFRRLSESQDALISAQNAVTAALIDYQRARLQLYTDIGILDTSSKNYWLKANPTTL